MSLKRKQITANATEVPSASPFVDSNYLGDVKFLCSQIMDRFNDYKKARVIWDPYIFESIAFYAGKQNMWWNPSAQSLQYVIPDDASQTQAILNRIVGKCRAAVSRMTSFEPTAQVLPNSPSASDMYAARAGKKIIQSNYFNNGYKEVYRELARYCVVEGMGWVKTVWDDFGGKLNVEYQVEPVMMQIQQEALQEGETFNQELGEKMNGEDVGGEPPVEGTPMGVEEVPELDDNMQPKMRPVMDEQGRPKVNKMWFTGNVLKRAVGPMSMYYNPTVMNWKDAFDCVQVEYMSVDEIKNGYPNCEDISEKDCEQNNTNPWQMVFGTAIDKNPYGQQQGIPVFEYWAKACQEFPRGLHVIIIKDKIRVGRPMPTINGEALPYDFCKYISIPGTMRGMSMCEYLKNPQTVLNKLYSQYIDSTRSFAVPKILCESTTKLSDAITNGVQVIRYVGQKPEFQNPQAVSQAHMTLIEFTDGMIDTVSGINKTAEGNPPPNITSGEMSEAVTENDFQLHMTEIEEFVEAIAGSCSKELRYVQDKAPAEVLIRFIGPNGAMIIDKFKKSVINNNFDVKCIPGKMGNISRSQQRKDIELITPFVTQAQADPKQRTAIINKTMELMQWGDQDALIEQINLQQHRIMRIISQVQNSAKMMDFQVHPMPFDDLDVWKTEIESTLLGEEYEQWPQVCKDRLMILWQEVTMTLNQQQVEAAMMMQGPPPDGGGGQVPSMPGEQRKTETESALDHVRSAAEPASVK